MEPLDLQPSPEEVQAEKEMREASVAPVEPLKEAPKEEAKAAPEPEAKPAEEQKQAPQQTAFKKSSPIDTIRELRAERRQLREDKKNFERWKATAEERLQKLANPEVKQALPDPQTDPDGYTRAELAALKQELAPLKEDAAKRSQAQKDQMALQERIRDAAQYEQDGIEDAFEGEEARKGYQEAINFLHQSRLTELELSGVRDAGQREMIYQQNLLGIHDLARQNGSNLAETLFKLAETRGWKKAAPEPAEDAAQSTKALAQDKLAALAAGQKAAKVPSKGGGGGSKGLTLEELVAMDAEEFDRINQDRDKVRSLFGR